MFFKKKTDFEKKVDNLKKILSNFHKIEKPEKRCPYCKTDNTFQLGRRVEFTTNSDDLHFWQACSACKNIIAHLGYEYRPNSGSRTPEKVRELNAKNSREPRYDEIV